MARIPYASLHTDEARPLVARIVAERGSVLHLYQMLLHSPVVAEGWLALLTAIRQKAALSGRLRELVIMRIAVVNGAAYEAVQHAPIALKEGMTQAQIDALDAWETSSLFSETERAVLTLSDQMTRQVQVREKQLAAVNGCLGERETVELVATIAAYNMVSRFLEAFQIHAEDKR